MAYQTGLSPRIGLEYLSQSLTNEGLIEKDGYLIVKDIQALKIT